jgi:hypothetical protein
VLIASGSFSSFIMPVTALQSVRMEVMYAFLHHALPPYLDQPLPPLTLPVGQRTAS